ncbi:MAG: hypothetical protein ABR570_05915 [Burkholderiales bacterium]
MRREFALAFLMAATAAFADEPQPAAAPERAKERPPLKLRLEETTPGAPRVTFEPREGASKVPGDTLPALGGQPAPMYDQRAKPGSKSSPFPADTNPGR